MDPRLLPCRHTYCLDCLQKMQKKKGGIKCQICNSFHRIPENGVDGFPQDLNAVQFFFFFVQFYIYIIYMHISLLLPNSKWRPSVNGECRKKKKKKDQILDAIHNEYPLQRAGSFASKSLAAMLKSLVITSTLVEGRFSMYIMAHSMQDPLQSIGQGFILLWLVLENLVNDCKIQINVSISVSETCCKTHIWSEARTKTSANTSKEPRS